MKISWVKEGKYPGQENENILGKGMKISWAGE